MQRIVSFVYNPPDGKYKFFGAVHNYSGSLCQDLLKVIGMDESPHYFEIWAGGKNHLNRLERIVSTHYEPMQASIQGQWKTVYEKVNKTSWKLNGDEIIGLHLVTAFHDLMKASMGTSNVLLFDVYTYGVER